MRDLQVRPKATNKVDKPRRRRSSVDTAEIVRRYQAGDTIPDIAKTTGHGKHTVRTHLLHAGVQLRDDRKTHSGSSPKTYDQHLIDQIRELYVDQQLPQTEVADRLGIGLHVVQRAMARHSVTARPAAATGRRNKSSKLSPQQCAQIADRYQAGESATALAKAYGVSSQSVYARLRQAGVRIRSRSEAANQRRSST